MSDNIYYRVLMAVGGGYYIHLEGIYDTPEKTFDAIDKQLALDEEIFKRRNNYPSAEYKPLTYAVGKYNNQTYSREPLAIMRSRDELEERK